MLRLTLLNAICTEVYTCSMHTCVSITHQIGVLVEVKDYQVQLDSNVCPQGEKHASIGSVHTECHHSHYVNISNVLQDKGSRFLG